MLFMGTEMTEDEVLEEIDRRVAARLTDGRGQASRMEYDGGGTPVFTCMYRDDGNVGCAVGCLVPDEHYDPDMEGAIVSSLSTGDGKWVVGSDVTGFQRDSKARVQTAALARALNESGIPATTRIRNRLVDWQSEHDNHSNWHGHEYVGRGVDRANLSR